jgi:hypothetical protein
MGVTRHVMQYGQRRLARKMFRSMPFLGSLLAIATLGLAIRRKGVWRGAADTALDFVPFVGGVKNAAEAVRGRDFFPDRTTARR